MKKNGFLCLLCILMVFLFPSYAEEENNAFFVKITFFAAGKADAILIETQNHTLLLDTGTDQYGQILAETLPSVGITHLDALIITHFDKDHVGGADHILLSLPTEQVYEPHYPSESKQTLQYREALQATGLTADSLETDISFSFDEIQFSIWVTESPWTGEDKNEENDHSLIVCMEAGSTRFLFAGDAENERLKELLKSEKLLSADVLKVPHHGKPEKKSEAFFSAVHPAYAIITSSEEEMEDAAIVSLLNSMGTQVFLTRFGTIVCISDGSELSIFQE